jgi:D-alanyl-D-alanine carboxypeptidase (penicillin-binding protein 5/6)
MRKFIIIFLSAILTSSYAYAFPIQTKAKQAIIYDYSSDMVLFEKEARVPVPPSSMSKLMTVYLVFEQLKKGILKPDDTMLISEKAWKKKGSKMFIGYNERVKIEDLLRGIITQSGNDACIAVAEGISGSEDAFAEMLNYKAQELGLENSFFVNSTGWPHEKHMMSLYDIALLSSRLYADFPEYYHLFSEESFTYNKIKQYNRNTLIGRGIGIDGLKTGHTTAGGYGMAISGEQDGRRVIVVVNGLNSKADRINEAERLIQYAFRNYEQAQLLKKGQVIEQIPVWFGNKEVVTAVASEDIKLTLPKGWAEKSRVHITYESPLPAPISAGDKIASMMIDVGNNQRFEIPLVAGESVDKLSKMDHIIRAAEYFILGV